MFTRTPLGPLALVVAFMISSVALAPPVSEPAVDPQTAVRRPWETDADFRIRLKLQRPIPRLECREVNLEDVLAKLAAQLDVNLIPNWAVLSAAAIEKDHRISLTAENTCGDAALRLILEQAAGGETELMFDIRDGVIRVSTNEDCSRETITCTYFVEDLLNAEQQQLEKHLAAVFKAAVAYSGREIATNSIEVERLVRQVHQQSRSDLRGELQQALLIAVDPESWREAGGNVGSMNFVGDHMIIVQTRWAHARIWDLLEALRARQPARKAIGRWP